MFGLLVIKNGVGVNVGKGGSVGVGAGVSVPVSMDVGWRSVGVPVGVGVRVPVGVGVDVRVSVGVGVRVWVGSGVLVLGGTLRKTSIPGQATSTRPMKSITITRLFLRDSVYRFALLAHREANHRPG